ncbi:MAG TPA: GNAT family N-acetyltransferase [Acidimicrobiia bacterium]|nr:GNAT family N-acetyltransferase [Acidimicrobiia bacterium]
MNIWDADAFRLSPVAEAIGPFCTHGFLEVVSAHDSGEPLPVVSDDAFLALRRVGGEICFAGDADVTDYHTPFGEGAEDLIARFAHESLGGSRLVLDSLPEEAAKPLVAGLTAAGCSVSTRIHEVTAVLDLPDTFDDYLTAIGKKERHELRRKRRRYERLVAPIDHVTFRGSDWAMDEFVRLHRLSEGEKGRFMSEDRADFFRSLFTLEGWRLDALMVSDGCAAMVFGYSDPSGYYLYNSAFDPEHSEGSPGVVLLGSMIEQAIAEGMPRFDFLKGDEGYKFRLGARRRPLLVIEAVGP